MQGKYQPNDLVFLGSQGPRKRIQLYCTHLTGPTRGAQPTRKITTIENTKPSSSNFGNKTIGLINSKRSQESRLRREVKSTKSSLDAMRSARHHFHTFIVLNL